MNFRRVAADTFPQGPVSSQRRAFVIRLLFLNYEFPPVGGGAAYASLETARERVRMGHSVDFLTSATPDAMEDAGRKAATVERLSETSRIVTG